MQVCPEARHVAKTVSLPPEDGACPLAVRGIGRCPARGTWLHVALPPAPMQRTPRSGFQDGHLLPESGLLLAQGSQVKRDKGVTFSKVPPHGGGKTPNVSLVAYFLHFGRGGQASDEFGKYPPSDRPAPKFRAVSRMPCDPSSSPCGFHL